MRRSEREMTAFEEAVEATRGEDYVTYSTTVMLSDETKRHVIREFLMEHDSVIVDGHEWRGERHPVVVIRADEYDPLGELRERLEEASVKLSLLMLDYWDEAQADDSYRLEGKIEGVDLVISYIDEMLR